MTTQVLGIAIAGGLGTVARYAIDQGVLWFSPGTLPLGTWIVNIGGSLLFGILWGLGSGLSPAFDTATRTILLVGFCGGFTTFSTYAFQNVQLLSESRWLLFALNVVVQNLAALIALRGGIYCASWFATR